MYMTMKRFSYLFCGMMLLAAMTACQPEEPPQPEAPQSYTMTIQATKGTEADSAADGSVKRALSLTGHTLNATWNEGEKVEVHQSGAKIGELTAIASDNASTTLTGSFASAPSSTNPLMFYFHEAVEPHYSGQDGTLATIASKYDFCAPASVSTGDFTVDDVNKTISVPGGITFGTNQQAIVKFTLKKKADNSDLEIPAASTLTVNGYTVTPSSATNVLFVALPATNTVILTSDLYGYRKTNANLVAGKYYEITVKMSPRLAVKHSGEENYTAVTANTTLVNGDVVTGTLFEDFAISIASGATVTLSDVTIVGGLSRAGITCQTNATITLAGTNTIQAPASGYPGILVGNSLLTINGSGSLTVAGGADAAGIGCGPSSACGNIRIEGGTIEVTGGNRAASIGSGYGSSCGDITISGTHSVTLNNPNNSNFPVDLGSFMDTGRKIYLAQTEWTSGSHWKIETGLIQDNTLNVEFGCLTAQQFVYRPMNQ